MDPRQRRILLVALHELYLTRTEFGDEEVDAIPMTRISPVEIPTLASTLGGDPDAVFFGASILG
jgi:hypothetical protein